ncbi:hypothetical protein Tco_0704356 [Tanacetum coccineum]|uniref:Reverse transcriptase domain-containing protein n=1 Tax=Tanacetum coccineum TaxID=301880 RepID=A0ABQ4Y3A0_9ASTR
MREIMWNLDRDVGYGITDTWDEMLVDMSGAPTTDHTELGRQMTEFTTMVRQDTYEIYTRLDDEQTKRQLMAGRLNMLYRDRRAHARTARLMEAEAKMSQKAWGRSMDASDLEQSEVMALRTQVVAKQAVITELQAADRRRQAAITKMLAADHMRQAQFIEVLKLLKRLQIQMTEFERQQGPAKGPAQPDAPKEAENAQKEPRESNTAPETTTTTSSLMSPAQKLEMEIWDLKVKGTDLTSYTQRFQELALLCGRMFLEESDKIEKYVDGLPDMIHGSVVASKPKTMQDVVEIATELMDKKIRTFAER